MPCSFDPDAPLPDLWKVHDACAKKFRKEYLEIMSKEEPEQSFLDLKITIAEKILRECHLCEWRCGVDRTKEKGFCRLGSEARVASYFLHWGEESVLVPSGTIFFSSCNFRCVYCQNYDISFFPESGKPMTPEELARIMEELEKRGAMNINLVGGEPTPNILMILKALRETDIHLPVVWNSNMYCSAESMKLLLDVVDLWLPDFKYGNDACAWRLSGVRRYFHVVTRNLCMIRGRDVLVRHLVLPRYLDCCTERIFAWISENTPEFYVNVMFQYHPEWIAARDPEYSDIDRFLTGGEMKKALELAHRYGIKTCQ